MSRLDKFNKKWGASIARVKKETKQMVDEQVLLEEQARKEQREIEEYGAKGVKELMDKANMSVGAEEAVAVFTTEGMKLLASLIGANREELKRDLLNHEERLAQQLASNEEFVDKVADKIADRVMGKFNDLLDSKIQAVFGMLMEGIRNVAHTPVTGADIMVEKDVIVDEQKDTDIPYGDVFISQSPRNRMGWAEEINQAGIDYNKHLVFAKLREAEEMGITLSSSQFKAKHPDGSPVYQRALKLFGKWEDVLKEYRQTV